MKTNMKHKHPFEFVGGGVKDGVPYFKLLCPLGHKVTTFMRDSKICSQCVNARRKERHKLKTPR